MAEILHKPEQMSYMSRKFTFYDHQLAYLVRDTVFEALKKFDYNHNGLFQENQIRSAIIEILGEDQNQVHYAVKNMLRYDRNNDGHVTYDQFTNFSVEQHFGEMAIQRLHRKGFYSKGNLRVMTLAQFGKTLDYCFSFINVKGSQQQYDQLFKEVDLNKDGLITYEDYFIFLRQYFGSKSQAFYIIVTKQQRPKQIKKPDQVVKVTQKIPKKYAPGQSPEQRLARLIYSQLRISILMKDTNQNLVLQKRQIEQLLSQVFHLTNQQIRQFLDKKDLSDQFESVPFQNLMRKLITWYFCELDLKNTHKQLLSYTDFSNKINQMTHFVRIKPIDSVLKQCFNNADMKSDDKITHNQYISMMKNIFMNYKFDTRGLSKINTVRKLR